MKASATKQKKWNIPQTLEVFWEQPHPWLTRASISGLQLRKYLFHIYETSLRESGWTHSSLPCIQHMRIRLRIFQPTLLPMQKRKSILLNNPSQYGVSLEGMHVFLISNCKSHPSRDHFEMWTQVWLLEARNI